MYVLNTRMRLIVVILDLAIFITSLKMWNDNYYFWIIQEKHYPMIISTLWAFRWTLFEKIWSSSLGGSTHQIFPCKNPHTKHMGVGVYGKIHYECGTTYSAIAYWFLAMINDQITTNRCFLGKKHREPPFRECTENYLAIWPPNYLENRRVTDWNVC